MVVLRKLKTTFNSSFNSPLLCCCSKNIVSFVVGANEASSSTQIALVNQTCFIFSLSICPFLKASTFLSSSFSFLSRHSFSKALSLMAFINMKK
jgi:hypothetical protein